MVDTSSKEFNQSFGTGNLFYLIFFLLSVTGLIWLSIWGFTNNSLKAISIGIIFSVLSIVSVILSRADFLVRKTNFLRLCASFFVGFFVFILIGGLQRISSGNGFLQSVFSSALLQPQSLFATISGDLPAFWNVYLNTVTVPFVEELFWLFGLPFVVIWITNIIGDYDSLSVVKNPFFQFLVMLVVCGVTFAVFHVNNLALVSFLVVAFVFRALMLTFTWGQGVVFLDSLFSVAPSFAFGAHMANNISVGGLMNWLVVMSSSLFGQIVLLLFGLVLVLGFLEVLDNFVPSWDFGGNEKTDVVVKIK